MHMQLPSRKDSNLKNAILKRTPSMLPTTPTRLMSPSTIIGPSVTADDPYLLGTPDANLSLKETWVRNQLNERASEYKQVRKLSVVVGTWNVNQKVPGADCSMEEWLHLDLDPDIIAVGLQEIDMTAQAMIKQETDASVDWVAALDSEIFGAKSRYVRLAEKQLVGMFLTVYVKEKLSTKVRDIKYESLGLGAMGTMGNKGGIGIRFRIFQTTFCFITSHFVPHMGGTPKRNQNFADILSQLDFGGQAKPDSHDYLFWCGDFNYRIDNMESAEVKKLVKAKQFKQLLEHDQLMTERMSGRVFLGFKEGDVTFAPTYKYDVGTLTYDTSEKQRVPSWTDRILWKGKKRDRVRNRHYGRYELLISDHLPVSGLFDVEAQTIIEHKYRACRESLGKEYDNEKIDSSQVPSLKLSSEIFYFDNVAYEVPRTETIELVNTGSVVCEYQFVPMEAGQDECCKPWLNISQVQGLVLPNQSVQLTLTVLVDQMTAPDLNTTDGTLEDTLLIILENGPSYTVNIRGKFLRTCFGNSLRNLIHIHGPARNMNPDDLTNDQRPRLPIPKEIFKMIDYLSKYALRTPGLLSTPADTKEVDKVRDMMDRGESLSMYNGSPHAVLEGLVHLLESLPQPLIPYKHYKLCIEHHQDVEKLVQDVSKLPPVHYNVFQYLMAFLRELLVHCDANGLTADHISQTCCDAVLRTPLNVPEEQQVKDRYAKIVFIKNFLRDDQELIMNVSKKELFRIT